MRLLEFEAKRILGQYGITTPDGMVFGPDDTIDFAYPAVLKAQVPIGGRGKNGGILPANSAGELRKSAKALFGRDVRGYAVTRILAEQRLDIQHEFFMAILVDTVLKAPVAVFSDAGGVDVETRAGNDPAKFQKAAFSVRDRLPPFRAREIVAAAGISGKHLVQLGATLSRLADVFLDNDATLAEINPLALTADGRLAALDCHLEIDDDALDRHHALAGLKTATPRNESTRLESDFEKQAAAIDHLDHRGVAGRVIEFGGDLGLLIGGGGASLTAFDAVRAHGARPANYCEVGGNPTVGKVAALTQHILSKPGVSKIAVIMNVVSNTRADLMARGVIKGILAAGKTPADTLTVFRVPGAWEHEGAKILDHYGIVYCDRTVSIDQAAKIAAASTSAPLDPDRRSPKEANSKGGVS